MDQKMFEEKNKKGKMEKYFLQKKRGSPSVFVLIRQMSMTNKVTQKYQNRKLNLIHHTIKFTFLI
jgi:hypothetical protein